ncbi:MAG: N-acetylmuramic acid 6-phosphate etherase [Phycisphaerales bacterium]|nr:N-acetylmuramic acid 6-phosphate etherase [Phycisphaerales bacterium]
MRTEHRNERTNKLHQLTTAQCVEVMQREDRMVIEATERARPALVAFIEAVEAGFVRGGRLVYVGAGTSGRLGVLDASEAPPTFQVPPDRIIGIIAGGDAALRKSSEGLEDDPRGAEPALAALKLTRDDAVLGIAAGGTTPYVLGALEFVKGCGSEGASGGRAVTGLLTCSRMEKPASADHLIVLETGPEVLTGSTRLKAGTATKLALNTISTTLMIRSGRVYENLMVDLRATNDKLRDRAARIVMTLTSLDRAASLDLLDAAGGAVKTAVVMQRRNVNRAAAEQLLAQCGGRLDRALD